MQKTTLIHAFHCRRSKAARVIGLLASHTSELKENVPVIEVAFLANPRCIRSK